MTKQEIFARLASERTYQKLRWGVRTPGGFVENNHEVCTFISFMRHYLTEAERCGATLSGNAQAIEMLRKVVTLGIACFEQHGVSARNLSGNIINSHDNQPASVCL